MSEKTTTKEDKLKKFKEMGIPVPMTKVKMPLSSNRAGTTPMHKILEQIKNGAKKGEFDSILKKKDNTNNFKPLPVSKQKKDPK